MDDRVKSGGDGAPELIPLRRMAVILGVPSAWLRERAEAGEIPALHAGNRWLFQENAVRNSVAAMASSKAPSESGGDRG